MFEFPLIRFDNYEWNAKLQKGSFFMRTCLYYQTLESNDLARSDRYDGSIPDFTNGQKIYYNGKEVLFPRYTVLGIFTKCFTQCMPTDFRKVNNHLLLLSFSDETKKAILDFGVDSALIIGSPSQFCQQLEVAFNKVNEPVIYAPVEYLSENELKCIETEIRETKTTNHIPALIKNDRFKYQQEFRICVSHKTDAVKMKHPIQELDKTAKDETYTVDIGAIPDSCLLPISTVLTDGIMYDLEKDECYIRGDSKNA